MIEKIGLSKFNNSKKIKFPPKLCGESESVRKKQIILI